MGNVGLGGGIWGMDVSACVGGWQGDCEGGCEGGMRGGKGGL